MLNLKLPDKLEYFITKQQSYSFDLNIIKNLVGRNYEKFELLDSYKRIQSETEAVRRVIIMLRDRGVKSMCLIDRNSDQRIEEVVPERLVTIGMVGYDFALVLYYKQNDGEPIVAYTDGNFDLVLLDDNFLKFAKEINLTFHN